MPCGCSSGKKHQVELVNIVRHNDEVYSFDFKSQEIKAWNEGDSSNVYLQVEGSEVGKKFSYATLPEEAIIRFTTRIREERSEYKEAFSKLQEGDTIEISEPGGHFRLARHDRPIVMLSNGVGIASTRSLVKTFEKDANGIPFVLQINVDRNGKVFADEFANLMDKGDNFQSIYLSGREKFYKTLDFETQNLLVKYQVAPLFYVVGSSTFVGDTVAHLMGVGFVEEDIVTDGPISGIRCECGKQEICGCGSTMSFDLDSSFDFVFPSAS